MNPAAEDIRITKTDVPIETSIGNDRSNASVGTYITPPPIPAMVEIFPKMKPRIISKIIILRSNCIIGRI